MKVGYILMVASALPFASAKENGMEMDMHNGEHTEDVHTASNMSMDMDASPMSMEHHHGRPILQNPNLEPQQRKYWESYNTTSFFNTEEGNKFSLWMHSILSFTAFGLLAPVSLCCSTDPRTQWFYIPFQTVQSIVAIISLFFLMIYSSTAPMLYPGNAYSGFSLAMFILVLIHWVAMIVKSISSYLNMNEYSDPNETSYEDTPIVSDYQNDGEPNSYVLDDFSEPRNSTSVSSAGYASRHGSETDLSSFDEERCSAAKEMFNNGKNGNKSAPVPALVRKLAGSTIFVKLNTFFGAFAALIFHTLNYPLFLVGCGYLLTGLATAFLMGKGHNVFALLAHFIKGFVFFALGFIELARFFGAGASNGWAWNEVYVLSSQNEIKPGNFFSRLAYHAWPTFPSFEFLQSFLIFFYGATNVFLEHLGNEDGVWTHKDLQHASIAFMFFGGGLCGMILESRALKRFVSKAFNLQNTPEVSTDTKVRRGWSLNPMPAFIIFWTGALMSHHQQETELSTQIHIQWGTLFSLGAVIRLITIALLYNKSPKSKEEAVVPQRPFTEILVSFCLVCGGLIFMASNRETVEAMIFRGIDQMFTLNVSVGITVLMLAYFIGCLSIKGFAASRYSQ